ELRPHLLAAGARALPDVLPHQVRADREQDEQDPDANTCGEILHSLLPSASLATSDTPDARKNSYTYGSSLAAITSAGPASRMRLLCRIAMRSAIRNTDAMSCEMTTEV